MDLRGVFPFLLLGLAVAVAFVLYRVMRARDRRPSARPPEPPAMPVADQDNYLDSSHISGPIGEYPADQYPDAAARAAAALRGGTRGKPD